MPDGLSSPRNDGDLEAITVVVVAATNEAAISTLLSVKLDTGKVSHTIILYAITISQSKSHFHLPQT
jgi:hypothetical protein